MPKIMTKHMLIMKKILVLVNQKNYGKMNKCDHITKIIRKIQKGNQIIGIPFYPLLQPITYLILDFVYFPITECMMEGHPINAIVHLDII